MTTRASRSFTRRTRERIQAAKVTDRLIQGFNGEVELSRDQIRIGLKLMDKVLPSLKAVEVEVNELFTKPVRDMSMDELQHAMAGHFEEAGYIHKDNLAAMGYVHEDDLDSDE